MCGGDDACFTCRCLRGFFLERGGMLTISVVDFLTDMRGWSASISSDSSAASLAAFSRFLAMCSSILRFVLRISSMG